VHPTGFGHTSCDSLKGTGAWTAGRVTRVTADPLRSPEPRASIRRSASACASTVILVFLLASLVSGGNAPSSGSSPCPGSTTAFGSLYHAGTCTIGADTTWGNGTFVLRGDLVVTPGVRLTLTNLTLLFDPAVEQEWRVYDSGAFVVRGGTIGSNSTFHWRLETSTSPDVLVDLDGVNVSRGGARGGGPYSAFLIAGGNHHRFRHLAVTDSAENPDWHHAVISTWSSGTTDLRIENSTFRGTGRVLQMVASPPSSADIVVRDNTIEAFNGTGEVGAIYGFSLDIEDNRIDAGASQGIWIGGGGGRDPQTGAFHNHVTGNTVTTTGVALFVSAGNGYSISRNLFHGRVLVAGDGTDFSLNTISDVDAVEPVVSFLQNGTVHHNVFRNVTLHEQAALADWGGYGNVSFFANSLSLSCAGANCMAVQVINVQKAQRTIYPRFPTVEVSWNNVTWARLEPGSTSATLDTEFSERLYLHNNTQRVAGSSSGGAGSVTSAIVAGGLLRSVVENNTMTGPQMFGIYNYIYEHAGNVFQYNSIRDTKFAGIFQSGGSVIRHNRVERAENGWWICPGRPCAGALTSPVDLTFYDNLLALAPGGQNVTRMTWPDFLNDTFIGHGPAWSNDSRSVEPVHGGWLYFANRTIDRITWSNHSGARRVTIEVNGGAYYDDDPSFGARGDAALSIEAAIDRIGSVGGATFLRSMNPDGITEVRVQTAGTLRISVSAFRPEERYFVVSWEPSSKRWNMTSFVTDRTGTGGANIVVQSPAFLYAGPDSEITPRASITPRPPIGFGLAGSYDAGSLGTLKDRAYRLFVILAEGPDRSLVDDAV